MFIKVHKCDAAVRGERNGYGWAGVSHNWERFRVFVCLAHSHLLAQRHILVLARTGMENTAGFLGLSQRDTTPPPPPRPTSLVGGTYLIMCVIEKDATAVKEHTHASRKSCCVRKIKPWLLCGTCLRSVLNVPLRFQRPNVCVVCVCVCACASVWVWAHSRCVSVY